MLLLRSPAVSRSEPAIYTCVMVTSRAANLPTTLPCATSALKRTSKAIKMARARGIGNRFNRNQNGLFYKYVKQIDYLWELGFFIVATGCYGIIMENILFTPN